MSSNRPRPPPHLSSLAAVPVAQLDPPPALPSYPPPRHPASHNVNPLPPQGDSQVAPGLPPNVRYRSDETEITMEPPPLPAYAPGATETVAPATDEGHDAARNSAKENVMDRNVSYLVLGEYVTQ